MSDSSNGRRIIRSIMAIVTGAVFVVLLSIGTDVVLELMGVFPSFANPEAFTTPLLIGALAYRSAYAIGGSYIAYELTDRMRVRRYLDSERGGW